ncbi:MAG: FKBP-type peptidyl-prolyl cis-trans isomerase [Spirosomaceae bacterium]|nr:FKBP-type peptidyl-prolyl cis-trans isomerase [Spirosomataceae bacterium]MDP5138897.1 FKBP-type peptidyl-prolyl cis-trans isomerase [Spirosomataceae bacterium]
MKIAPNTVVTLTYELYIGEPEESEEEETFEIAEVVGEDDPMVFLHSKSGLPEAFEENLNGLSVGDEFNFWLEPEAGYGDYDPEATMVLPIDMFKDPDGNEIVEMLEIGNVLPFTNEEGNQINGQLIEISDTEITVDFNHPLAGKAMHFEGKVTGVREATTSELEHGHVHGEGGVIH